nr:hypothetical protein CFP56_72731 [Quercus suber]
MRAIAINVEVRPKRLLCSEAGSERRPSGHGGGRVRVSIERRWPLTGGHDRQRVEEGKKATASRWWRGSSGGGGRLEMRFVDEEPWTPTRSRCPLDFGVFGPLI